MAVSSNTKTSPLRFTTHAARRARVAFIYFLLLFSGQAIEEAASYLSTGMKPMYWIGSTPGLLYLAMYSAFGTLIGVLLMFVLARVFSIRPANTKGVVLSYTASIMVLGYLYYNSSILSFLPRIVLLTLSFWMLYALIRRNRRGATEREGR
ncbi:hypothetical protein [Lewinella sp. IMCC34191]|uniref:hypothetical protein n=1 Tax=Lewinella sp. IMCC34191 TaxID=2259172 RepID=UPI000E250955|nr:hypothetical protein [Lewinella sp. IMCC34191]